MFLLEIIKAGCIGHLASIPIVGSVGLSVGGVTGALFLLTNPPTIMFAALVGIAGWFAYKDINRPGIVLQFPIGGR